MGAARGFAGCGGVKGGIMEMMACPKCGVENSVRRERCFTCGMALWESERVPIVPLESRTDDAARLMVIPGRPVVALAQPPIKLRGSDSLWYVLAAAAAGWVIWGPIGAVMKSLMIAAIMIGNGAGLFAQRALEQTFPERDTRYLRVILGVMAALVACYVIWSWRVSDFLSAALGGM